MRHDVAHRDGLAVARRNLEIDVFVYVCIKVDLALLDQLHDRRPGEQLRNGTGPEEGRLRRYRLAIFYIGKAVALLGQDLAVLDDHDDCAGNVAASDGVGHEAVKPRVSVGLVQDMSSRGQWRGRQCW